MKESLSVTFLKIIGTYILIQSFKDKHLNHYALLHNWLSLLAHHCRFLPKTSSDIRVITAGFSREPVVILDELCLFLANICRFIIWTGSNRLHKKLHNFLILRTLYQSCSTFRDIQLCRLNFFDLRLFGCLNMYYKDL